MQSIIEWSIFFLVVFLFVLGFSSIGFLSYLSTKSTDEKIVGKKPILILLKWLIVILILLLGTAAGKLLSQLVDEFLLANMQEKELKDLYYYVMTTAIIFSTVAGILAWIFHKEYLNIDKLRDKLEDKEILLHYQRRLVIENREKYEQLVFELNERIINHEDNVKTCKQYRDDSVRNLSEMFNLIPKPLDDSITRLFASPNMIKKAGLGCMDLFAKNIKNYGIILDKNAIPYVEHIEKIMKDLQKNAVNEWQFFITSLFPPEWFFAKNDDDLQAHERGISKDIAYMIKEEPVEDEATIAKCKADFIKHLLPLFNGNIGTFPEGKIVKGHRLFILDEFDKYRLKHGNNTNDWPKRSFGQCKKSFDRFKKDAINLDEVINKNLDHKFVWYDDFPKYLKIHKNFIRDVDFIAFSKKVDRPEDVFFEYVVMYSMRGQYMRVLWWNNNIEDNGEATDSVFINVKRLWNAAFVRNNICRGTDDFCTKIAQECNYKD